MEQKIWSCKVCGKSFLDPCPPDDWICVDCRIALKEKVGKVVYYQKDKNKEEGLKFDKGKPRFDLLPPEPLFAIAEVLRYGAEEKEYGERNWEKGIHASRLFAAIQRHLWRWWGGETEDPESGLSHLSHALCDLVMLYTLMERRPDLDDRPYKEELKKKLQDLKDKINKNLEDKLEKQK